MEYRWGPNSFFARCATRIGVSDTLVCICSPHCTVSRTMLKRKYLYTYVNRRNVMSCHVMACRVMSCNVVVMSCHVMSCRGHVMPCCAMSCHVVAVAWRGMPCRAVLCRAVTCRVMSCHVMKCHPMLCHVIPCRGRGVVWYVRVRARACVFGIRIVM